MYIGAPINKSKTNPEKSLKVITKVVTQSSFNFIKYSSFQILNELCSRQHRSRMKNEAPMEIAKSRLKFGFESVYLAWRFFVSVKES